MKYLDKVSFKRKYDDDGTVSDGKKLKYFFGFYLYFIRFIMLFNHKYILNRNI